MNDFKIDATSKAGILVLTLRGALTADDMRRFEAKLEDAIHALRGATYCVFCDSRKLLPLSPEAAAVLLSAKAFSAAQPNFLGGAVVVSSPMMAMQHRRTSTEGGVMDTELISTNESACWEHLHRLRHKTPQS